MKENALTVVGGGLAGSESAWQAAEQGIAVTLYEMRPCRQTPVHKTGFLAELVCSNSLGTDSPQKAPGLLKQELRKVGSLILNAADETRVPAGQALAVDRERFAREVTRRLESHPNITVVREEVKTLPGGVTVLATGPLTSPALARELEAWCGRYLYYYDAVSPIVTSESLNPSKLYAASRYGHGEEDAYLNAPLNREEYYAFVDAVRKSERVPYPAHESPKFFEACMPVEELADRGVETLRFGPMKPVGLRDPRTGLEPFAVVQLRRENREATLYNLVGFQSRMKWGEQVRVFRMIPGLEEAEFVRLGVMHRNIFVNAPALLLPTLQLKERPDVFLAGQLVGVEGYVEDVAAGWLAGTNAVRLLKGEELLVFPPETALGALFRYVTEADSKTFQPMNINFGLFPPVENARGKRARQEMLVERAERSLSSFQESLEAARVS